MNPFGIERTAIDLIALRRYTFAVERSRDAHFADTYAKRIAKSEASIRYQARKKVAS